jgi:hypothetical protein
MSTDKDTPRIEKMTTRSHDKITDRRQRMDGGMDLYNQLLTDAAHMELEALVHKARLVLKSEVTAGPKRHTCQMVLERAHAVKDWQQQEHYAKLLLRYAHGHDGDTSLAHGHLQEAQSEQAKWKSLERSSQNAQRFAVDRQRVEDESRAYGYLIQALSQQGKWHEMFEIAELQRQFGVVFRRPEDEFAGSRNVCYALQAQHDWAELDVEAARWKDISERIGNKEAAHYADMMIDEAEEKRATDKGYRERASARRERKYAESGPRSEWIDEVYPVGRDQLSR